MDAADGRRWLDPAFAVDLWQGELGFTVWLRDDLRVPLASGEGGPVGR